MMENIDRNSLKEQLKREEKNNKKVRADHATK